MLLGAPERSSSRVAMTATTFPANLWDSEADVGPSNDFRSCIAGRLARPGDRRAENKAMRAG